jgi:hypothetical protein
MTADPPLDNDDAETGVVLARATFDKTFEGPLAATSKVHMTSVRTKVEGSAAYVAVERIAGVLDGRKGTFVVTHAASMSRGNRSLTITIAPDSGTGELVGIAGKMDIQIVDGRHYYEIDYELGR